MKFIQIKIVVLDMTLNIYIHDVKVHKHYELLQQEAMMKIITMSMSPSIYHQ